MTSEGNGPRGAPDLEGSGALRQDQDLANDSQRRERDLEARVAFLEDQLAQLQRRHNAVMNSTIWRATAPLRAILSQQDSIRLPLSRAINFVLHGPRRVFSSRPQFSGDVPLARRARLFGRRVVGKAIRMSGVDLQRLPPRVRAWATPLPPSAPQRRRLDLLPWTATGRAMVIEFVWTKTARPADFNMSTDTRALAAGFQELTVSTADEADRPLAHIDFRTGGNALRHTLYGFSAIEPWGAWTTGGRSAVLIWLPEDAPEAIRIAVSAGVFEPLQSAEADVLVDGQPSGRVRFDGREAARFEVVASKAAPRWKATPNNVSLDRNAEPDVSVVILDYNKPAISMAAAMSVLKSRTALRFEVLVYENGCTQESVQALKSAKLPVRLIEGGVNRYFGEGNNLAAQHARAPYLVFLNNDAMVTDDTLDLLVAPLMADPSVGAVGPVFRYPDGAMQEAGAFLNPDGTAYQRGKLNAAFDVDALPDYDVVDYVSAACLCVRKDDFFAMGGFDLRFDPAYYEDSDLCLRLAALGKRTLLASRASVVHVENATSSDPNNKGIANAIIDRQRQIFLARWAVWLADRSDKTLPVITPLDTVAIRRSVRRGAEASPINLVYTPFPLVLGGGERYILGVADALSEDLPTAVVTPDEYSALRLNALTRELGFEAYRTFPGVERDMHSRSVDVGVVMGNELLPTRAGFGRTRIYHCQFPFPTPEDPEQDARFLRHLGRYKAVVVNSAFTRGAYLAALDRVCDVSAAPPVEIIAPPVRLLKPPARVTPPKENLILTVGRISMSGHAKRHDVVLDAFADLVRSGRLSGWRLALCGSVPLEKGAADYYEKLVRAASATPGAEIVLAPSRAQLDELFWRARVYVSATGFGVDAAKEPWRCEHFGITVAEAASAGCVPVGYHQGGPAEIITELGHGETFTGMADLKRAILAAADASQSDDVRAALMDGAHVYDEQHFLTRWRALAGSFVVAASA